MEWYEKLKTTLAAGALGIVALFIAANLWKKHTFEQEAKVAASKNAADPESAEFRNLHFVAMTKGKYDYSLVMCGEMNLKNQYGAYMGYSSFAVFAPHGDVQGRETLVDHTTPMYVVPSDELCGAQAFVNTEHRARPARFYDFLPLPYLIGQSLGR